MVLPAAIEDIMKRIVLLLIAAWRFFVPMQADVIPDPPHVTAVQYSTAAGPRLWFPALQTEAGLGGATPYQWTIYLSRERMGIHEPYVYQQRADVVTWQPDPEMALLAELPPGRYFMRATLVTISGTSTAFWGGSPEMCFDVIAPEIKKGTVPWVAAMDGWTTGLALANCGASTAHATVRILGDGKVLATIPVTIPALGSFAFMLPISGLVQIDADQELTWMAALEHQSGSCMGLTGRVE